MVAVWGRNALERKWFVEEVLESGIRKLVFFFLFFFLPELEFNFTFLDCPSFYDYQIELGKTKQHIFTKDICCKGFL